MAFSFTEAGGVLVYAERVPVAVRVLIAGIGLLTLVLPLPFVLHADWRGVNAGSLLAVVAILVALALAATLWVVAGGAARELRFVRAQRRLVSLRQRPLGGRVETVHAFADVCSVDVHEHRPPDSSPSYSLHLRLAAAAPIELGSYHQQGPAAAQAEHLRRVLGLPSPPGSP